MRLQFTLYLLIPLLLLSAPGVLAIDSNLTLEGKKIALSQYFSTLPVRESPYADWRGVHPLSEAQSKVINHYRFDYDQQQRLIQISFKNDKRLLAPNHSANYFFLSSVITFDYGNNEEVRKFYNVNAKPMTVRGDVFSKHFELNLLGYRTGLSFKDKQGLAINNSWGIASYMWQLEADGSVIEKRSNLKGEAVSIRPGFDFQTIRLRYDPKGWLAVMSVIDPKTGDIINNGEGVAQDKLEFSTEGHMLAWNVLDANNKLKAGNGPGVARGIQSFNEQGYESGIRYENAQGKPIQNSYGWWGTERFYDSKGNMLQQNFVDKNSQITIVENFGYASYKRKYDAQDNLSAIEFFDTNGQLVNRADNGVARIKYTYKDNMRVSTKRFNISNQLIQ